MARRSFIIRLLPAATLAAMWFHAPLTRAAGGPMGVSVQPGAGLTLSGTPPAVSASIDGPGTIYLPLPPFTAVDSRGSGDGWHITIGSGRFTCSSGCTAGSTLPAGSLIMAPPSVSCGDGLSCIGTSALPVVTMRSSAPIDGPLPVEIASAAPNTGMGSYRFVPGSLDGNASHNLALSVPPGANGTYTSTLTVSLISGP